MRSAAPPFRSLICGLLATTGALFGASLAHAQVANGQPADAPAAPSPRLPYEPVAMAVPSLTISPIANRGMACATAEQGADSRSGLTSCAIDDAARGFAFTSRQETGIGQLETFGAFASSTTGLFSPERQLTANAPGFSRQNDVFQIGLRGDLFDKRLKVLVQTATSQSWLAPQNIALVGAPRFDQRGGTASTVRLEGLAIDRPGLRWTVTGQMDLVSDNYSTGEVNALPQLFAMPGNRFSLTNQLKLGQTSLKASVESYSTSFGKSRALRFGFDRGALSLRLAARNSRVDASAQTAFASSQSNKLSAYLDIDTPTLLPAITSGSGLLGQLLPGSLSLGFDSGETASQYGGTAKVYQQGGWELSGNWETRLGSTSVSYRHDSRRALSGGGGARFDDYLDISHSIRKGHWRFGFDATISSDQSSGAQAYSDHTVSFGPTVAYNAVNGPEFMLRVGHDSGQSGTSDGSYLSNQRSTSIVARLDLTSYLRQRFDRNDLHLKVEYRRRLESSADIYSAFEQELFRQSESYAREGLLMTFGMRLN